MHDWINETDEQTVKKVECKCSYKDLEDELITLAGFNLRELIDKLKAGYTIEPPEEDTSTPHLVDVSFVDDNFAVYVLGPGVEWEDLTDFEKYLVNESQEYLSNKEDFTADADQRKD